jgi:ABC-type sugar transport system ATPase subunit
VKKLELVNIIKDYFNFHLEVSFDVFNGELVSILGPSGSGKTTVLHIIAGFVPQDSGKIIKEGTEISKVPPEKRNIGIVFQDYALFPFLDIFSNIAFGLKIKHFRSSVIKNLVYDIAEKLEITGILNKSPDKISGGEAQRVAIARALVVEPDVVLMDEPMSSLDAKIREKLIQEVKLIKGKYGITMIYVTHDQKEAMYLSDRIILFNNGRVEQIGTPLELYAKSRTLFAQNFIGKGNLLRINGVDTFVRPEDIIIASDGEYYGKIKELSFLGGTVEILIESDFGTIFVEELYRNAKQFKQGDRIRFTVIANTAIAKE